MPRSVSLLLLLLLLALLLEEDEDERRSLRCLCSDGTSASHWASRESSLLEPELLKSRVGFLSLCLAPLLLF